MSRIEPRPKKTNWFLVGAVVGLLYSAVRYPCALGCVVIVLAVAIVVAVALWWHVILLVVAAIVVSRWLWVDYLSPEARERRRERSQAR